MPDWRIKNYWWSVSILFFLLGWYSFFLFQKIDLTTADLGRHLKNGELILAKNFAVLSTNFYSYTHPDHPFLNHHWGSGVVFFLIEKISGFTGLHLVFILLSLFTFYLFFRLAEKNIGWPTAALLSLLIIPLLAQRSEVRPEVFTYFFSGLFLWLLWRYQEKSISPKYLFVLPLIQIFWVNSHIYFFLGPILVGLFLLESILLDAQYPRKRLRKETIRFLSIILILTALATAINPFGFKEILYPLEISQNYGYRIVENQSVFFLERLGFIKNPNFFLFKVVAVMLFLTFISAVIVNRKSFSIVNLGLSLGWGIAGFSAIRNFTPFALFALPLISLNLKNIFASRNPFCQKIKEKLYQPEIISSLALIVFIITLFTHAKVLPVQNNRLGLGLIPDIKRSVQFFKENKIQGPIFNNYDIGSYLIFYLYPEERIFVDNRPEAYPASFLQEIYIPLQENEEFWQKQADEYQFNTIFFSRQDLTPWAQKFLIERAEDVFWAPVFVDQCSIIFLKRNESNKDLIEKYEIPKEMFKIK